MKPGRFGVHELGGGVGEPRHKLLPLHHGRKLSAGLVEAVELVPAGHGLPEDGGVGEHQPDEDQGQKARHGHGDEEYGLGPGVGRSLGVPGHLHLLEVVVGEPLETVGYPLAHCVHPLHFLHALAPGDGADRHPKDVSGQSAKLDQVALDLGQGGIVAP